jgi:hypothetical protein
VLPQIFGYKWGKTKLSRLHYTYTCIKYIGGLLEKVRDERKEGAKNKIIENGRNVRYFVLLSG